MKMNLAGKTPEELRAMDERNAANRQRIAERQGEQYAQVLRWAWGAFGVGWFPSGKHFLILASDFKPRGRDDPRPVPVATVWSVKNEKGEKRHFTVEDGKVVECSGYEEGFRGKHLEEDPERPMEFGGKKGFLHKYSLCWAAVEPAPVVKSAEELAALRESRERGKKERAEAKELEEAPLFREEILELQKGEAS